MGGLGVSGQDLGVQGRVKGPKRDCHLGALTEVLGLMTPWALDRKNLPCLWLHVPLFWRLSLCNHLKHGFFNTKIKLETTIYKLQCSGKDPCLVVFPFRNNINEASVEARVVAVLVDSLLGEAGKILERGFDDALSQLESGT